MRQAGAHGAKKRLELSRTMKTFHPTQVMFSPYPNFKPDKFIEHGGRTEYF